MEVCVCVWGGGGGGIMRMIFTETGSLRESTATQLKDEHF